MLHRQVVHGLLLGLGLFSSFAAQALTLGDLVVYSRPGQPLRATIPLTLQENEPLAQTRATLATVEQYKAQHVAYPPFLEGMRIALLDKGEGHARLQLFGEKLWQGEEAVLLVEVSWPQGQMSQRFHIAAVSAADASGAATPRYVEVGDNDTLDAIAIRLSRGSNRSYLHMMYALFKANPDAFYGGNMNNLKHGARLRVPTETELYQLSDAEVFRGIREQTAESQKKSAQDGTGGAGSVLAGISDEQAAALINGKSPEELQAQLQRLNKENEAMLQRNEELKTRLAKLEQQMQQMSQQVLEYPANPENAPSKPVPSNEEKGEEVKTDTDAAANNKGADKQTGTSQQTEGLPDYLFGLVMVLVVGAAVVVWRRAIPRQRGGQ